jgi:superfamily I DNA and RNA helicase
MTLDASNFTNTTIKRLIGIINTQKGTIDMQNDIIGLQRDTLESMDVVVDILDRRQKAMKPLLKRRYRSLFRD